MRNRLFKAAREAVENIDIPEEGNLDAKAPDQEADVSADPEELALPGTEPGDKVVAPPAEEEPEGEETEEGKEGDGSKEPASEEPGEDSLPDDPEAEPKPDASGDAAEDPPAEPASGEEADPAPEATEEPETSEEPETPAEPDAETPEAEGDTPAEPEGEAAEAPEGEPTEEPEGFEFEGEETPPLEGEGEGEEDPSLDADVDAADAQSAQDEALVKDASLKEAGATMGRIVVSIESFEALADAALIDPTAQTIVATTMDSINGELNILPAPEDTRHAIESFRRGRERVRAVSTESFATKMKYARENIQSSLNEVGTKRMADAIVALEGLKGTLEDATARLTARKNQMGPELAFQAKFTRSVAPCLFVGDGAEDAVAPALVASSMAYLIKTGLEMMTTANLTEVDWPERIKAYCPVTPVDGGVNILMNAAVGANSLICTMTTGESLSVAFSSRANMADGAQEIVWDQTQCNAAIDATIASFQILLGAIASAIATGDTTAQSVPLDFTVNSVHLLIPYVVQSVGDLVGALQA